MKSSDQNSLPSAYDPAATEDKIYRLWEESGYFNPDHLPGERPEAFVISMPPVNVTGILHVGHALENALMDAQIRYQRLRGKRTLIVPGTDHAAVATQARVESELKAQGMANPRQELGRENLIAKIRAFTENHKSTIIGQIKKMGTSCDWSRLAYTFDEPRSKAVNEIFRRMFSDGLIYRGYRVVNWSVAGQSTCSDDELVYETRKTTVYTFKYSADFPIPIATTRPETKLGDTAVAVNPADERYAKFIGQKFTADVGAAKPLVITIIGDQNVDMNYGTGAVGVTPAHSQIDFEMYQKNKDIGLIPVIGKDGRMLPTAGPAYQELTTLEARDKFVAWLKEKNLYLKEEEVEHNVGTSDRFKDVVEALPMEQWFIDVNKEIPGHASLRQGPANDGANGAGKSLKDLMREAVTTGHNGDPTKVIRITPERFQNIYLHWIDNLRDWCISRQIWWGHRIPIWYCDACGEIFYGDKEPYKCPKCASEKPRQDEDTLDTWFSSGTWTFSTLGWPNETDDLKKYHPTDWMQMGYEILFFWMARMILMTAYALDDIPFKNVYIHGLMRAKDGRKFSKSSGNGLDPLEVIDQYGTDALRLSLIKGVTAGNDSRFYEEKVEGSRNFVNKLWNISRFILSSFAKATDGTARFEKEDTTLADRWISSRFSRLIEEVTDDLDSCRFSAASEKIYEFLWHDFADWYLEISKIQGGRFLLPILSDILKLLHPFTPFVTEEIYQKLTANSRLITHNPPLLMVENWPQADESAIDERVEKDFEDVREIIVGIRNTRSENKIEPAKIIRAVFVTKRNEPLLTGQKAIIEKLTRVEMEMSAEKPRGENLEIHLPGVDIFLPLAGLVDEEKIKKEIQELENYVAALEGKLANPQFAERAPKEIVDKEKAKLEESRERLEKMKK